MEKITVSHLSFCYPRESLPALQELSFTLTRGEFVTLTGVSGSGKTTLLRLLKPEAAPYGTRDGSIFYDGAPQLSPREAAEEIGYVTQSPEEASVCEKVYAELAFGLESLGVAQAEMRARVAETAAFFGLEPLFHRSVASLSGGQKQLLQLASVMVLRPSFLLLDEPTAQLDPLAASHFLDALAKINRELGTTILLSEHRLEEALALSGRILALENGRLIADGSPREQLPRLLRSTLAPALPTPARVFLSCPKRAGEGLPLSVGEGRVWLASRLRNPLAQQGFAEESAPALGGEKSGEAPFCGGNPPPTAQAASLRADASPTAQNAASPCSANGALPRGANGASPCSADGAIPCSADGASPRGAGGASPCSAGDALPALAWDELWFRYEKDTPDILRGLSGELRQGEIFAILGGNGAGKSTALSLFAGLRKPYRGKLLLFGKSLCAQSRAALCPQLGLLPQDPQALLLKSSVAEDLREVFEGSSLPAEERAQRFRETVALCELESLLNRHPYDLSGGEQQRAALAKILLLRPRILLLDEPTKGQDAAAKARLGKLFLRLRAEGHSLLLVSHDLEFCAALADRCALFFDGQLVGTAPARAFFCANRFYTTAAHRMSDGLLPEKLLASELICACGGTAPQMPPNGDIFSHENEGNNQGEDEGDNGGSAPKMPPNGDIFSHENEGKNQDEDEGDNGGPAPQMPPNGNIFSRENEGKNEQNASKNEFTPKKSSKKSIFSGVFGNKRDTLPFIRRILPAFFLLLLPLTLYWGTHFLTQRAYLIVSFALLFEILAFFLLSFENSRPRAAEILVLATLCAIGVCGRAAFFMLPQMKPVVALAMVAGLAFGGEVGFLVGALTALVSNLFFGQGPWTPWQMLAFGLAGFLAGVVFRHFFRRSRAALAVFGFLLVLLLCGPLLDLSAALLWQESPTAPILLSYLLTGLPFNLLHAGATALFLWFFAEPLLEKLERIRTKYGIFARQSADFPLF